MHIYFLYFILFYFIFHYFLLPLMVNKDFQSAAKVIIMIVVAVVI